MTLLLALMLVAQAPWDIAKKAVGGAATGKLEGEINKRLLDEGRKNQCTFKTDSDQFDKNCDKKLQKLGAALIDAKKKLNGSGVQNFKFEVSGHTDSSGNAAHNKELSQKRAAVIVKELIKRGIPEGEIIAVGMGSEAPLVKPDDTPAKKARNRRYEIRVRL
jgi:outer membrane protein OmpA-like peptidoglycan-associated protein